MRKPTKPDRITTARRIIAGNPSMPLEEAYARTGGSVSRLTLAHIQRRVAAGKKRARGVDKEAIKAIKEMTLKNPNLTPEAIMFNLKQRGFNEPKKSTIISTRQYLRVKGKKIPNLQKLGKGRELIKLGSKTATAMKEIHAHPTESANEIQQRLKKKAGILSPEKIYGIKSKMKRWFPEIDFYSRKPKPIILTKAQEAMIPEFERLVERAAYFRSRLKVNWPSQEHREFKKFVLSRVANMAKKFDPKRGANKKTFVNREVEFLMREFVRESIRSNTGLTKPETELIIRIYREKARGLEDHRKIAGKLGISKKEVDELWRAYQASLRIKRRTGQREEQ